MRFFLLPISWIYWLVLFIRHKLYDFGLLHSKRFDLPVICVGNLDLGGTGKTPHVEYLLRLLKGKYSTAVLSRGYRRSTQGFIQADANSSSDDIGDEPLQYTKFDNVIVTVDEDRVDGVEHILSNNPSTQVIVLDDAFQHRKIKPSFNILLTDYHKLFNQNFLLPAGTLRDIRQASRRADVIIVTKSPNFLSPYERRDMIEKLKSHRNIPIFFSYITFLNPVPLTETAKTLGLQKTQNAILFTGIANPTHLIDHLKTKYFNVETITFKDHHSFKEEDIDSIVNKFSSTIGNKKIIFTTEKDAMRLKHSSHLAKFENLPLFYIPIEIRFHNEDGQLFNEKILEHVRKNFKSN